MAIEFVNTPKGDAAAVIEALTEKAVETVQEAADEAAEAPKGGEGDALATLRAELDGLKAELASAKEALTAKAASAADKGNAAITAKVDPEADLLAELLADPESAFDKLLTKREQKIAAQRAELQTRIEAANAAILAKHPDMTEISQKGDFRKWVDSDPTRKALMAQSDRDIDASIRVLLLDMWKATSGNASEDNSRGSEEGKAAQKAREKAAGAAGAPKGATASTGVQILKRADVQKLMVENRAEYERLLPQIRQAYAEGRVR